jgi:hypothetical protein
MLPAGSAILSGLKLLIPIKTIIMAIPPNKILPTVLIKVENENGTTGEW